MRGQYKYSMAWAMILDSALSAQRILHSFWQVMIAFHGMGHVTVQRAVWAAHRLFDKLQLHSQAWARESVFLYS